MEHGRGGEATAGSLWWQWPPSLFAGCFVWPPSALHSLGLDWRHSSARLCSCALGLLPGRRAQSRGSTRGGTAQRLLQLQGHRRQLATCPHLDTKLQSANF